mgnify:CR=1 FL=1
MVEFDPDLIIPVAVLATLVAIAAHPGADAEPKRQGTALGTAIAANTTQAIAAPASHSLKTTPSK